MKADEEIRPVIYLRRYAYTHHSTGTLIKNGPWVTWHVVKQPRPGDRIYKYDGEVPP